MTSTVLIVAGALGATLAMVYEHKGQEKSPKFRSYVALALVLFFVLAAITYTD